MKTSDTQYRPLRREHGAFGHPVRVGFCLKRKREQAIRSIARSAASTRTPPAQGSRRACRETSNRIAPVGKTVDNQSYGTALTPGGRCLRAPRQSGVSPQTETKNKRYVVSLAPPRARGRCPRRAVEERVVKQTTNLPRGGESVDNRPYGTALTPGGRCLRAPRQNGIASNRGRAENERIVAVLIRHGSDGLSLNTEIE